MGADAAWIGNDDLSPFIGNFEGGLWDFAFFHAAHQNRELFLLWPVETEGAILDSRTNDPQLVQIVPSLVSTEILLGEKGKALQRRYPCIDFGFRFCRHFLGIQPFVYLVDGLPSPRTVT